MTFLESLHQKLDTYHLLKHTFYQNWSMGKLTLATLKEYAQQYYHHVADFPRYLSATHSRCNDLKSRQILLANLIDEEQGEENHPELWLRFAESLGSSRHDVIHAQLSAETKQLVDGYHSLANNSYATGLGALYAYERQVPDVAKSKIDGLKEYYGINDEESLKFFNVHIKADEWHSQECADLLNKLNTAEQHEAMNGAVTGALCLWKFLDGVTARALV